MCAVREDGELICWSPDREGVQELGGGFVDVSTGAEVCAVCTDATAWCWGGLGVFASRPPQGAFVRVEAGCTLRSGQSAVALRATRLAPETISEILDVPLSYVRACQQRCGAARRRVHDWQVSR